MEKKKELLIACKSRQGRKEEMKERKEGKKEKMKQGRKVDHSAKE